MRSSHPAIEVKVGQSPDVNGFAVPHENKVGGASLYGTIASQKGGRTAGRRTLKFWYGSLSGAPGDDHKIDFAKANGCNDFAVEQV